MQRLLILLLLLLLLLSACVSTPKRVEPTPEQAPAPTPTPNTPAQVKCMDCGMVLDIRSAISTNETTAPRKPVLSGIVGGVVSKPSTAKPSSHYEILIQLLNGKKVVVTQALLSAGLRIGSKVRVSQGRILAVGP